MKAERRLSYSFCFSRDGLITIPVARSIWSGYALLMTLSRFSGLRNRAESGLLLVVDGDCSTCLLDFLILSWTEGFSF